MSKRSHGQIHNSSTDLLAHILHLGYLRCGRLAVAGQKAADGLHPLLFLRLGRALDHVREGRSAEKAAMCVWHGYLKAMYVEFNRLNGDFGNAQVNRVLDVVG